MRRGILNCFLVCFWCGIVASGVFISGVSVFADGIDWRNFSGNWTTPAKDQMGGSCWAYDPTSSVESRYMMTRNDPSFAPDFSEQQLIWETSPDLGSLSGGAGFELLFQYYIDHGVVSETECPGQGTDVGAPPYWPLASGWENRVFKSTSYTKIWNNNNATYLKNLLKTSGPFLAGIQGSNWYDTVQQIRDHYVETTYDDNHSIEVVGFQDDATCPTGGYWICKNSWGTGRGDNGTGYMPYGSLEITNHLYNQTGPVYYSGPMYHVGGVGGLDYYGADATKKWTGTTSNVWDTTSGTSGNWNGTFQWVNQEVQAGFDSTGSNKAISVNGTVIAHGLTIITSGYSFAPANGSSALTITSGGISTSNSATFSTPIYIGGPQTWNVTASGQTLTVSGALHTVISDLTIAGAGNVTISGLINGGGVMNSDGPATGHGSTKPGGIIKNNTGSLTLSGASTFGGDITVNTGTLTISPAANATFSGAFMGSGALSLAPTSAATISIGGGNSNFTGSVSLGTNATLAFIPATGAIGSFTGAISGTSRPVVQNGPGTTILTNVSGRNTYTGSTSILNGALQANSGYGLPSSSMLVLNGGVLQGDGATTFTRSLSSTAGSDRFYWPTGSAGGGFSASTGTMNVRINNGTGSLTWGTTQGTQLIGTLMLSSESAAALTNFQNGLNLNGGTRTVRVVDNLNSTADYAQISNVISGTGTASILTKTGSGLLYLSSTNTYAGKTVISDGVLRANIGTGVPSASNLSLNGGVFQPYSSTTFTRAMGTGTTNVQWTSATNGGGFAANTSNLTVNIGGSSGTLSWGSTAGTNIMGPLKFNSPNSTGTLTFTNGLNLNAGAREIQVNGSTATLSGVISGASGSSLTKTGVGTLVLSGTTANTYSGATTITKGNVDLNKSANVVAIPGDIVFANDAACIVRTLAAGQVSSSSKLIWNFNTNTVNYGIFNLMGNNLTVAGISDPWFAGIIENTLTETGYGNSTLTVNNPTDCAYYGFIRDSGGGSGTLSLTKQGAGTLTLVGTAVGNWSNVSYTGPTLISGGKLVLQDAHNAFTSAITNNAILELRSTILKPVFTQPISGSGSLLVTSSNSTGWVTLSNSVSSTFTGGTTLREGGLVLLTPNGANAIPGNITIADSGDGTPTYLVHHSDNGIASTGVVSFNPTGAGRAVYVLNGCQSTVGGISDITGAGSISNGCATASNSILTINSSVDSSYNGALQDGSATCTLGLTKTGAGTLTLVGTWGGGWQNISYTGPTTISGGKLVIQDGVNAFASTITNNAALEIRSSNVQFGFSKPIGGTGSVAFKSTYSAGYIALGNTVSNTYTGGTTVQGGGLVLQASGGAIAIPGDMTISDSGDGTDTYVVHYAANQIASTGVVSFNPTASGKAGYYLYGNAQTLAGISDSTNYGKVANGSSTPCTLTISNSNCTYNGILTDGGTASLALVKTGLGTMTLGGTGVIDLTGGITVNGGNLYLAKTSGVAVPGALNMSAPSGNTWVYVNGNNQFGANATLNFQGGYYPYFVMQGYNVSVAGISDSNGTGVIENTEYGTASLATLTINNSTACSYNGYIRDTYAGSGQLAMIKNGTGTLTLSGDVANNFTGGLTINAGTVDFENTENDVAHPYTVNAGGHLVLNGVQLAAAASAMSLIAESATDDYANAVPDTNNGTMSIVGSTYFNARNLVGTGTLMVKDDAVVYAHSLVQDTLVIGGTSSYSPAVAVPEPGTMMLLAFAILALAGVGIRKMNRG